MPAKASKPVIVIRDEVPPSHIVWAWHPLVHKRFGEELFYFLLAVKPFDRSKHDQRMAKLMEKFGVAHYCSYQLFGSFDCMLRVWLPSAAALDFKREAESITNVRYVQSFRVADKRRCWLTELAERKFGQEKIKGFADALSGEDVRNQQDGKLEEGKLRLLFEHALLWRKDSDPKYRGRIKAFIGFSEPEIRLSPDLESYVKKEIDGLLASSEFGFEQPTLMFGEGFCWALTKVVAENLNALGRFVHAASGKVGIYGISTETHLVVDYPQPLEGDSVSATALSQLQMANPLVLQFLPELYQARAITPVEKARFEEFVNELLRTGEGSSDPRSQLSDEDLSVMQAFLRAAIADNRDEAFEALYPPIRSTERRLRDPLGSLAASCYPGGVQDLLKFLQQQKNNPPASLKSLTLRDVLQGAHAVLASAFPNTIWLTGLSDKDFAEIGEIRNTVMHDKPFAARTDWEHFARCMLKLFSVRNGFLELYEELEKPTPKASR